jgi:hypothetical protein
MQIILDFLKDNWVLALGFAIGLTLVIKFKGGNKVNVKGDKNIVAGNDVNIGKKNAGKK